MNYIEAKIEGLNKCANEETTLPFDGFQFVTFWIINSLVVVSTK